MDKSNIHSWLYFFGILIILFIVYGIFYPSTISFACIDSNCEVQYNYILRPQSSKKFHINDILRFKLEYQRKKRGRYHSYPEYFPVIILKTGKTIEFPEPKFRGIYCAEWKKGCEASTINTEIEKCIANVESEIFAIQRNSKNKKHSIIINENICK